MCVRGMRLVATALVVSLAGPALAACDVWAALPSDRHACCAAAAETNSPAGMADCCGMSEQSDEATPAKGPASLTLLTVGLADAVPATDWIHPSRVPAPTVSSASRQAALLPPDRSPISLRI